LFKGEISSNNYFPNVQPQALIQEFMLGAHILKKKCIGVKGYQWAQDEGRLGQSPRKLRVRQYKYTVMKKII
jgi:hypothetical protein